MIPSIYIANSQFFHSQLIITKPTLNHILSMLKSNPVNDCVYFHQACRPRHNNPTYVSSHMNDSLTVLNPPNDYTKTLIKETSYKQSYESSHQENSSLAESRKTQYNKFSKAAFEKNRSLMSNYGATILRESNRQSLDQ